MLSRLARWLGSASGSGDDSDDSDDADRSGFAGSLLDASVNFSHGQEDGRRAVREMQKVNEEASKLRDADDHRP